MVTGEGGAEFFGSAQSLPADATAAPVETAGFDP